MKKGFVLTLDASVAASVAILMGIAIISFAYAKSPDTEIPYSIAGDLLSSLDAKGELLKYPGYSSVQISQSMQTALQVLPKNFCGNITVRIFNAYDFSKVSAYSESSCSPGTEAYRAKRVFADYDGEKFGIAEIGVWAR